MMTRLTMPSVKGRRSILAGSLPATQAAVPSATAAALPQVTMPHSAPVNSAMRLPAASISSSRLTNWREAASTAARTCGSIRLPPCIVRTLQQLMNGRTPSARYGLVLGLRAGMSPPGRTGADYSSPALAVIASRQPDPWPDLFRPPPLCFADGASEDMDARDKPGQGDFGVSGFRCSLGRERLSAAYESVFAD